MNKNSANNKTSRFLTNLNKVISNFMIYLTVYSILAYSDNITIHLIINYRNYYPKIGFVHSELVTNSPLYLVVK